MNMSFSLTTPQFCARTKTVTRRVRWRHAKPGMVVMGVENGMGLKKGEKVVRLHRVEFTAVRRERLSKITQADVVREGFPGMTPAEFVDMFCRHNRVHPRKKITVIDFRHLDDDPVLPFTPSADPVKLTTPGQA